METQSTSTNPDVARYMAEKQLGPYAYVVLVGLKTYDIPRLIAAIGDGLPWKAFERFRAVTGLSVEQVAEMAGLPRRTLARRKKEGRLTPDESDRLVRAARVYGQALRLFDGDRDTASSWFTSRVLALGAVTPLEFMRTELGAREVENVIGRAAYGVYS
ncbi:MAG TPA: antitoxin Xre-like helix-turn-helix domain-containing protein [Thermoanaerobaculia bacterium]|jgi:putative toxin-antitoxin system antitoxin component (TIGR02293 family)